MPAVSKIPGAVVVWIVSYLFFLSTLVNNFSASHDSIHYLLDILHGRETFHQHHLLYNFFAARWMSLFSFVSPHYAIESFTAIWGSGVLAMVYSLLRRRFFAPVTESILGTAIVAFSYGVWFYSTNIEVYMPPLFFILACLFLLSRPIVTRNTFRLVALLHSAAILFHQINVLFIVVILFFLVRNRRQLNVARALCEYALIGIVLVGGAYFLAGWVAEGHRSLSEWIGWMEGYSVGHDYWQPLSTRTPIHVATGFTHAFIGGHFIFQLPPVAHALERSFSEHGLSDEIFLSSNISAAGAWLLLAATIIFAVLFCGRLISAGKTFTSMEGEKKSLVRMLLCTIIVYSIFFCFWMPEILEFWIPQMVLVWIILVGMPAGRPTKRGRVSLVAITLLLCCINFFGSMRWLQHFGNDWYYVEARRISAEVRSGDLLVVHDEWILKDYLRYYTSAEVIATDEPGYSDAAAAVAARHHLAAGGKVFIYRDGKFSRSY